MKIIQMIPKRGIAKPESYSSFYGLLKLLPGSDKETLKEEIIYQFTGGRTHSLREMSLSEYNEAIRAMEKLVPPGTEQEAMRQLKKRRSDVLHQMQLMGVDTADWKKVDAFCRDRRIAGKCFRHLDDEELSQLLKKLRAIRRKKEGEE
ncbi:hypothetical protein NBH15_07260 [Parabacteroides sp. W1-Q-101]|uniref:hypothetical protein n=1 Tax=Parabacteroides TaxID=375288 RepID=UPI00202DCDC7|nr:MULTISPECIES: hypothetical protein [Parabacteroides]MCM0718076.1 hypothetical protein [Parabacteroides sp. W1-Q-101]